MKIKFEYTYKNETVTFEKETEDGWVIDEVAELFERFLYGMGYQKGSIEQVVMFDDTQAYN